MGIESCAGCKFLKEPVLEGSSPDSSTTLNVESPHFKDAYCSIITTGNGVKPQDCEVYEFHSRLKISQDPPVRFGELGDYLGKVDEVIVNEETPKGIREEVALGKPAFTHVVVESLGSVVRSPRQLTFF